MYKACKLTVGELNRALPISKMAELRNLYKSDVLYTETNKMSFKKWVETRLLPDWKVITPWLNRYIEFIVDDRPTRRRGRPAKGDVIIYGSKARVS